MTLLEIALDDVAGAGVAEHAGADRIELCAGLGDGGITPSIGLIYTVADQLSSASLMVLIRPRAGDFVFTREEVRVMLADIKEIRHRVPTAGFVIGALEPLGDVDAKTTAALVAECAGASVTFNKAFDSTRDISRSLETLIDLGVHRVLTSGGRRSALDGVREIRHLVEQSGNRIGIMAAGSVRPNTAATLVAATGVTEVHLRAAVTRAGPSVWSNPEQDYGNATVSVTDDRIVRSMVTALEGVRG